ncbi:unnamed protein product [Amoebophrya sp. A120]|nr:unnamed protein product [Amoebophrya sp. A120]|eukprot:GSA120T00026025001.1
MAPVSSSLRKDVEWLIMKARSVWSDVAGIVVTLQQWREKHDAIVSGVTDARARRLHTLQLEALEKWIADMRDQIFELEVCLVNEEQGFPVGTDGGSFRFERAAKKTAATLGMLNLSRIYQQLRYLLDNIHKALRGNSCSFVDVGFGGWGKRNNDQMKVLNFLEKKLHKEVTILEPAVEEEEEPLDHSTTTEDTTRRGGDVETKRKVAVTGTAIATFGAGFVFAALLVLVAIGLGWLQLTKGEFLPRNW